MENTMIPMTSQQRIPATETTFGMPTGMSARGCAFAWATDLTGTRVSETSARIKAVAVKGHVAFVAYVPGSHAWSPPI